jgi:3-methyladenine DNA glycosylase AlkC
LPDTSKPAPLLKEVFNRHRLRHIADEVAALTASFDRSLFIEHTHDGLDAAPAARR